VSKAEVELRQKCLGFQLDPNSIWSYPRARSICHIGIAINDAMHAYWANGICNSEIALVNAVKRHTHMDVSHLCDAMVSANWKRHKPEENKRWCKRLWTPALFGEYEYKGSATQCHALMALMRWYCETLWVHIPCLRAVAECFLALARCTDALRQGKKTHDWSDLDKGQSDHHKLFATVHPGLMRPKHHHRLHLSNHYRKHHVSINCWGIEQSHQNYKTIYAVTTCNSSFELTTEERHTASSSCHACCFVLCSCAENIRSRAETSHWFLRLQRQKSKPALDYKARKSVAVAACDLGVSTRTQ